MSSVPPALSTLIALPFAVAVAIGPPAPPHGQVVFRWQDPAIVESSGLVVQGGLFVTVNDSGDTGRVFAVDRHGRTVGVTTYGDAVDVESVAPLGHGEVLVGDTGDNLANRDSITLHRVGVGAGDRDESGTTYELTYPDGGQDAETLMVQPQSGQVVIVTKGVFGGRIMLAPERLAADHANRLREAGSALPIATDGSFFPDGRHFIVRNYTSAAVYTWPGLDEVGHFELPAQQQGEGIAVAPDGRVYVSTEGARSAVLRITLPRAIRDAVGSAPSAPTDEAGSPHPGPLAGQADEPERSKDHHDTAWWWVGGGGVLVAAAGVVLARRRRGALR